MANMSESLRQRAKAAPDNRFDIVITLASDAKPLSIPGMREIAGFRGLLKGNLTGREILALENRNDIVEIAEDFEVQLL